MGCRSNTDCRAMHATLNARVSLLLRAMTAALVFIFIASLFAGCAFFSEDGAADLASEAGLVIQTDPVFVFAAIADPHIPDSRMFPPADNYAFLKALSVAEDLLAACVTDINSHSIPVDFTLVLGDISDEGTYWELSRAAEILAGLEAPYYPVVGNHDNFQDDNKQAWKLAFGRTSTSYSFIWEGFKFIVIDPTLDPFDPPDHMVEFDEELREWVRSELEADPGIPSFLVGHYPLRNRCWNAAFQTFESVGGTCLEADDEYLPDEPISGERGTPYREELNFYRVYEGGKELREVLEASGNAVASINGHVHANRVDEHNGVVYVDVGATLVGRPSIRYFYVYPDRVEVDFEYISDDTLFNHVRGLCPHCFRCFDPERVCDFIDGRIEDKRFTIWF